CGQRREPAPLGEVLAKSFAQRAPGRLETRLDGAPQPRRVEPIQLALDATNESSLQRLRALHVTPARRATAGMQCHRPHRMRVHLTIEKAVEPPGEILTVCFLLEGHGGSASRVDHAAWPAASCVRNGGGSSPSPSSTA